MRVLAAIVAALLMLTTGARAEGKLLEAFSGRQTMAYLLYALQPNCLPLPWGEIHFYMPQPPAHGKLYWRNGMVPTNYPASNPRSVCNGRARPGITIWYKSNPGYRGSDHFILVVTFPAGGTTTINRPVEVHG